MTDAPKFTLAEVVAFLCGEKPLDGVWFGSRHPTERGMFWWRKHLRAATAGVRVGSPTPRVDALMKEWDDDGATRGAAFMALRDLARELESALGVPARVTSPRGEGNGGVER